MVSVYLKFYSNHEGGPKLWKLSTCSIKVSLKYVEVSDSCLSGRAYVHRRSADTNLVEIHVEMSELLDKQVYVLNECFKYKFQDSRGGHASPRKVCDENKRKKLLPRKNIFDGRKEFIRLYQKTGRTNFD